MQEIRVTLRNVDNFIDQYLISQIQPNVFLLLSGEIAAGKTTLVKRIASKLGIKDNVNSPTFSLLHRYKIREELYLNHFDFFRISPAEDLKYFHELTVNNINIIEWPENNMSFWKKQKCIKIEIKKTDHNGVRLIVINSSF